MRADTVASLLFSIYLDHEAFLPERKKKKFFHAANIRFSDKFPFVVTHKCTAYLHGRDEILLDPDTQMRL